MWMTQYINEIRRQFRDKYNFTPSGGTENEPLFDNIPDGEYPMVIEGQTDYVRMSNGTISCCNDSPLTSPAQPHSNECG